MTKYNNISEMKRHNKSLGRHYFDKAAMDAFNSKIYPDIYNGVFFIESTQFKTSRFECDPIFKIVACINGKIERIGKDYDSLGAARCDVKSFHKYFPEALEYYNECFNNNDRRKFRDTAMIEPENSRDLNSIEYSRDSFTGACTWMMVNHWVLKDHSISDDASVFFKELKTMEKA